MKVIVTGLKPNFECDEGAAKDSSDLIFGKEYDVFVDDETDEHYIYDECMERQYVLDPLSYYMFVIKFYTGDD